MKKNQLKREIKETEKELTKAIHDYAQSLMNKSRTILHTSMCYDKKRKSEQHLSWLKYKLSDHDYD